MVFHLVLLPFWDSDAWLVYLFLLFSLQEIHISKYCFSDVFVRFVHLFFICLRAKKFSLDGHLLYLFLILHFVITALLSSFVIKGALSYIIWWNFGKYLQLRRKKAVWEHYEKYGLQLEYIFLLAVISLPKGLLLGHWG